MLVRCAAALIVGMIIAAFTARYILKLIYQPYLDTGGDVNALVNMNVIDPFSIHMEISLFGGIILALPFILYYLGQFLLPALTPKEKRFMTPIFGGGALLFLVGVLFCYVFVLKPALKFFLDYSNYFGMHTLWTAKALIDFEVQMLVGFGLAFEMPLVLVILNILGIVSSKQLAAGRRFAMFIIFVAACCIVPTTDPFTLSMLSVPLYVLYEACVWISYLLERRKEKQRDAES